MSKKTILKVIAAICVISLCFSAVFTGAVSAEPRSATASITGSGYHAGAKDSYVSAEITFTSGTAFTAGSFTFSATGLTLVDCSTVTDGVEVYVNPENGKVLFAGFDESENDNITELTDLTLVAKFSITNGALADQAAGTYWTVNAENITITNTDEETYTCDNATGTIHVHNFGNESTTDGVTTYTCSFDGCTEVKTEIENISEVGTNKLADEKQANLSFPADGDTVLNALVKKDDVDALGGTTYFVYEYKDDEGYEHATATSTGTVSLGGKTYYVFPCGRNGGIGRMSRNIKGNFINVKGGTSTISADWEYSIMTYLNTVIEDTNGDYSEEDKNYAKALRNYGYYTTARLAETTDYFDDDLAAYTANGKPATYSEVFNSNGLADKSTADTTGGTPTLVSTISVTTGYKPKMNIKLRITGTVTICAYNTSGVLVYKKSMPATAGTAITISDIPTKYLDGTIEITNSSESTKTFTYGFGRYALARVNKSAEDANVFKAMMNYAYYLGQKFA